MHENLKANLVDSDNMLEENDDYRNAYRKVYKRI